MAIENVPRAPQAPPTNRRILLASIPRTASNLFSKILNVHEQPDVHTNKMGGYYFYDAHLAACRYLEKPGSEWSQEEKKEIKDLFQTCFNDLEDHVVQAQSKNKIMFAKEHTFWFSNPGEIRKNFVGDYDPEFTKNFRVNIPEKYGSATYSAGNETILPDEYLRNWQFLFIIRHPALAFPSLYRAMIKMNGAGYLDEDGIRGASVSNMTMRWSRMLYDWAIGQPDIPGAPLIVDAHDLIHTPQVVLKLCENTGLDPNSLKFEWGTKGGNESQKSASNVESFEGHRSGPAAIMLSTLQNSSKPNKALTPAFDDIDIAAEAVKWKTEFGDEIAGIIEKAVRDSMEDYEYLRARRITV